MNARAPVLATLGALLVLAAGAAALSPLWRPALSPQGAICRIVPGDMDALLEQRRQEELGHDLASELAALRQRLGGARAACPLPEAAPGAASAQAPPAALPADRWQQRDLSLMEGCWQRETNMSVRNVETGQVQGVRRWQTCFDRQGRGTQQVEFDGGRGCTGPVTTEFLPDGALRIHDAADCVGDQTVFAADSTCRRVDENVAVCDWMEPRTGARGTGVRLRR